MAMDKKFVMDMIDYMKENRHMTIAEKCNLLGISVPGYYKACQRHGLNGGMRSTGRSKVDTEAARKVMEYARKVKLETLRENMNLKEITDQHDSDTLKCTQAQDSLE